MNHITAQEIIKTLKLEPLKGEGGMYTSTYRSTARSGSRYAGSAIFYFLCGNAFSHMHRLATDEVYHFYLGDPVELLELHEDGDAHRIILGPDLMNGHKLQHPVTAGCWQGSHLLTSGGWALMGTTMSPAFDPAEYELGNRQWLTEHYSQYKEIIHMLTGDFVFY